MSETDKAGRAEDLQRLRERMRDLPTVTPVEARVGGGMVTVRMGTDGGLLSCAIDPELLEPENPEMLQDLIVAAVNQARHLLDEAYRRTHEDFEALTRDVSR